MRTYPEYKVLRMPENEQDILAFWKENNIFLRSVENRNGAPAFTFYEGPPSANGIPGIHHVMARTLKDIFCRYKTLQGFQVHRKGGWDTHGLPVELQVEKMLGITKEDIGKTISVAEYNAKCREDVLKFKDVWDDLTVKMGYWVDLDHPYVTFENEYIESVWNLLKQLYEKKTEAGERFLYKGFTIQPYSPAAGTGLSSHELNYAGTYRNVKDSTAVAQFKVTERTPALESIAGDLYFLAWTTTPWTLPANTALAVGENIEYQAVRTFNPHTYSPVKVILAKALTGKYFSAKTENGDFTAFKPGDKDIPWKVEASFFGRELVGAKYEQLLPFVMPAVPGTPFRVIPGDFVSTEDGTGIVHIAPTFGGDDFRVARQHHVPAMLVEDAAGNLSPLVDRSGRFLTLVGEFGGEYVKEAYLTEVEKQAEIARLKELPQHTELNRLVSQIVNRTGEYLSVDDRIVLKLQLENKLFKKEKYEHTYPHCWRTDKPILYYPLDSWFIRTTAVRDRMVELNKTINWKPESTGTGRFGNWLENLVDWNLSRSRYWGIPLPVWRTKDGTEERCIGSIEELQSAAEDAVSAGLMRTNPVAEGFDVHRPFVDEVILQSPSGQPMYRETDLIDVWFDSGAMPYAQNHFMGVPGKDIPRDFPADYIAEGVDQTRGWFFTLHAIAVMLFDSVAYKNVIANGLVLDKDGNKMSKRLGNAVDPFDTLAKYGADATRWYMIGNAAPWENLKFNVDGITEVQRKFFGTLFNTYNFFALYANIDGFTYTESRIPAAQRDELDQWILSLLNSLTRRVAECMDDYDPTRAVRAIEDFVSNNLSNWYVRLSRRRFWKGELNQDKVAAYQTLYECLETVSRLMSPFAPFFSERLYRDLNSVTSREVHASVHLTDFPLVNAEEIDMDLEERMRFAEEISSLVRSIRKKTNLKVRQPLQKILLPVADERTRMQVEAVKHLILAEVNVKDLAYLDINDPFISKKVKPNFKTLGPKLGPKMKDVAAMVQAFGQAEILKLEQIGTCPVTLADGTVFQVTPEDVEIIANDIQGWSVAGNGHFTVALDITLTPDLIHEGVAREIINRIQNLRKELNFEVTDRINVTLSEHPSFASAIAAYKTYICAETLTNQLSLTSGLTSGHAVEINETQAYLEISK